MCVWEAGGYKIYNLKEPITHSVPVVFLFHLCFYRLKKEEEKKEQKLKTKIMTKFNKSNSKQTKQKSNVNKTQMASKFICFLVPFVTLLTKIPLFFKFWSILGVSIADPPIKSGNYKSLVRTI